MHSKRDEKNDKTQVNLLKVCFWFPFGLAQVLNPSPGRFEGVSVAYRSWGCGCVPDMYKTKQNLVKIGLPSTK